MHKQLYSNSLENFCVSFTLVNFKNKCAHVCKQVSPVSYACENGEMNSCIRGYHVFQEHWLPIIGERLECKRESGNPRDRSVCRIAVCKGDEIVGHVVR